MNFEIVSLEEETIGLVSHAVIADMTGNRTDSTLNLVLKYKKELESEGEPIFLKNGEGNTSKQEYFLTEQQTSLLIMLMKNSAKVVEFKVRFNEEFYEYRKMLSTESRKPLSGQQLFSAIHEICEADSKTTDVISKLLDNEMINSDSDAMNDIVKKFVKADLAETIKEVVKTANEVQKPKGPAMISFDGHRLSVKEYSRAIEAENEETENRVYEFVRNRIKDGYDDEDIISYVNEKKLYEQNEAQAYYLAPFKAHLRLK